MCDPATITMAIASGVQYTGQAKHAKRQQQWGMDQYAQDMAYTEAERAFRLERYIENAERATENVRRNYSEIDQRIGQDAQVASMEIGKFFAQARGMHATSSATDAERAVTGPTADYLMDNIQMHVLDGVENVRREQKWRLDAMTSAKDEIEAQGLARIESMNPQPVPLPNLPQPVQQPNAAAALLSIGANALSMHQQYLASQPKTPTTTTGTGGWGGSSYFGQNTVYGPAGAGLGTGQYLGGWRGSSWVSR